MQPAAERQLLALLLSLGLHLHDFCAIVVTAVRADVMRQLKLVTIRARHKIQHADRVMAAPLPTSRRRDLSFR
jgi:hypothetical protein